MKRNNKAFTLVEMLIVVVIIGILAAALIPRLVWAQAQARDSARAAGLNQLKGWLESYYSDAGTYPTAKTLAWAAGTAANGCTLALAADLASGSSKIMSDIPRDPQAKGSTLNGCGNYSWAYGTMPNANGVTGYVVAANFETAKWANFSGANTTDITKMWATTDAVRAALTPNMTNPTNPISAQVSIQ